MLGGSHPYPKFPTSPPPPRDGAEPQPRSRSWGLPHAGPDPAPGLSPDIATPIPLQVPHGGGAQGCTWATAVMSCRVSALGGPQRWQPFTHLWQGGGHPWGRGGRGIPEGIYVPSRLCPPPC